LDLADPAIITLTMNHEVDNCRGCAIVTIGSESESELNDECGALVRDALLAAGHHIVHKRWISDDFSGIRYVFREWVDDSRVDVIVSIGGVGLAASDTTPEALSPLVTKPMPGFGEIFRQLAFSTVGVSALESRALAAVCHSTLVYLLPAVPGAVRLGMSRLIVPQLAERLPTKQLRTTTVPGARSAPHNRIPGVKI
jgi:molybdenum cofactor biosynthesis protein B